MLSQENRFPDKRELRYFARRARFAEDALKMKELRRKLGVSQSEMARKTGVSSSLIWNIENGRGYLSEKMLRRLEIAFPVINADKAEYAHSGAVNQNTHSESNGNNTAEAGTGAARCKLAGTMIRNFTGVSRTLQRLLVMERSDDPICHIGGCESEISPSLDRKIKEINYRVRFHEEKDPEEAIQVTEEYLRSIGVDLSPENAVRYRRERLIPRINMLWMRERAIVRELSEICTMREALNYLIVGSEAANQHTPSGVNGNYNAPFGSNSDNTAGAGKAVAKDSVQMPSKPARKKLRELKCVSKVLQQLLAMVVVMERNADPMRYIGGCESEMMKRVAGYIRVKEDINQESGIALEAIRLREWIFRHPEWKCIDIYADQQPCWKGFNTMVADCSGEKPIQMVVIRSMRRFEEPERIKELPCPVFVEEAGIFTTDDLWPEYLKAVRVSKQVQKR